MRLFNASNVEVATRSLPGNTSSYTFDRGLVPGATYKLIVSYSINYVNGEATEFENTLCKRDAKPLV